MYRLLGFMSKLSFADIRTYAAEFADDVFVSAF